MANPPDPVFSSVPSYAVLTRSPQAVSVVSEQQGPAGPKGDTGPQGPVGPAATVNTFPITSAASFTAAHGLSYFPRVWIVDAGGSEVETDIHYAPGQVTAVFPSPFTGTLYLG